MLSFIQARSTGLLGGIEGKNEHLVLTFRKHSMVLETYERERGREGEVPREVHVGNHNSYGVDLSRVTIN